MHYIIAIISGIFIPFLIYFLQKSTSQEKEYLLEKFIENKAKMTIFTNNLKSVMEKENSFQQRAFFDNNITMQEYYNVAITNLRREYSEEQLLHLKRAKLSKFQIREYIDKLEKQDENLYILNSDLQIRLNRYKH